MGDLFGADIIGDPFRTFSLSHVTALAIGLVNPLSILPFSPFHVF